MSFAKTGSSKQVDPTVSYYTADANLLPPNEPMATGTDAIRKVFAELFGMPNFAISWLLTKVEVARSGDLGYTIGTYQMTLSDAKGKRVTDRR